MSIKQNIIADFYENTTQQSAFRQGGNGGQQFAVGGVCGRYHLLLLSVYLHALPGSVTYFTLSLLE